MASVGEEVEYESDPEEAKMSLTMRRREASDDEDEGEENEVDKRGMSVRGVDSRVSDCESNGEGAAAEYNEEESEVVEEEEFGEDEEVEEKDQILERESVSDVKVVSLELDGDSGRFVEELSGIDLVEEGKKESDAGAYLQDDQFGDNASDEEEGEKKENEPFAVPTAGAFYMHDDRFEDSPGGHHRRTLGGRKLWESRDDIKWGHDKFEELTRRERHYEEGRRASRHRNRGRGRGKSRGEERGYPRGNENNAFSNNNQNNAPSNRNDALNNENNVPHSETNAIDNQNNVPMVVKGRGPRRYQPAWQKNEAPTEPKQYRKSGERSLHVSSGRISESTTNANNNSGPARKHVSSSLNSASPPFYPSASSSKDIKLEQKMHGQASPLHQDLQAFVRDERFSVSQSNTMRGKSAADLDGINKLYIDDSVSTYTKKPLTNLQLQDSGFSSANLSQTLQSRVRGRGQASMGQLSYLPNAPHSQVKRVPTSSQGSNVQRIPNQARGQAPLQASGPRFGQHPGIEDQTFSPPNAPLIINSFEPREIDSLPESSKSNTVLARNRNDSAQVNGRGSFPYGGGQVMVASGNIDKATGDKNLSANPTFLPFMQFRGQHPGGMGVPAVGMAFPGYVGNPESGNSEMTWLPVLAGAAGAMGANYSYLSVDGAYNARPLGQTHSMAAASSKENNTNKPGSELKPSQRPELANDDFGQRQNKARRYTEMKFDQ